MGGDEGDVSDLRARNERRSGLSGVCVSAQLNTVSNKDEIPTSTGATLPVFNGSPKLITSESPGLFSAVHSALRLAISNN